MDNKRKTVSELLEEEEKLVIRIRDFLRTNSGVIYSAKDIADEIGIECVDTLLSYTYGDYLNKFGIERINTIGETHFDSCTTTYQYYCKPLRKMKWREYLGVLKQ